MSSVLPEIAAKEAAEREAQDQALLREITDHKVKLIPASELGERFGLRYHVSHLRRLWQSGRFPIPVKLAGGRSGQIAFVESEIVEWLERKIRERRL